MRGWQQHASNAGGENDLATNRTMQRNVKYVQGFSCSPFFQFSAIGKITAQYFVDFLPLFLLLFLPQRAEPGKKGRGRKGRNHVSTSFSQETRPSLPLSLLFPPFFSSPIVFSRGQKEEKGEQKKEKVEKESFLLLFSFLQVTQPTCAQEWKWRKEGREELAETGEEGEGGGETVIIS